MHSPLGDESARTGAPPSPPSIRPKGEASSDEVLGEHQRPVRPSVVRRVGSALEAGTYDPPLDLVVERLLRVVSPSRHRPG